VPAQTRKESIVGVWESAIAFNLRIGENEESEDGWLGLAAMLRRGEHMADVLQEGIG
jgi:hypothetical protein